MALPIPMPDHATRYDDVPYPGLVHPWSHPRSVGALASMFGVPAAPPEHARVLDLGCATGSNIIALAADLPHAHFVGVDVSASQIAAGRETIAALGLTNVTLEVGDLEHDLALGSFDYVIAHGVYSWVSPALQDRLLAHCKAHLAEGGVAYVSHNTYPGWHFVEAVRQLLLRRTPPDLPPLERMAAARDVLDAHLEAAEEGSLHRALLLTEREFLGKSANAYLYHEHFIPEHHPTYFEDFVAHARRHDLDYLTNARPDLILPGTQPPNIAKAIARVEDRVAVQQLIDHHRNTRFRWTLLCHAGPEPRLAIAPEVLARLHISLPRDREVNFTKDGGEVTNREGRTLTVPNRAIVERLDALRHLSPSSVPFPALVPLDEEQGRALAGALVGLFFAQVVDLTLSPVEAASTLPERPAVPAFNRFQARRGQPVTSRTFISQELDATGYRLVPLLDGTRDIAALAAELGEEPEHIEGLVRIYLDCGLLLDPPD